MQSACVFPLWLSHAALQTLLPCFWQLSSFVRITFFRIFLIRPSRYDRYSTSWYKYSCYTTWSVRHPNVPIVCFAMVWSSSCSSVTNDIILTLAVPNHISHALQEILSRLLLKWDKIITLSQKSSQKQTLGTRMHCIQSVILELFKQPS